MKSPSTHTLEAKSPQAVSSENLSKSTESTPLKLKVDSNEKDLNCTRESESEYFNGMKQEDFNKQCELDDIEFVPHFQRVYISGDDNSGVCFLVRFGDLPGEFVWVDGVHWTLSNAKTCENSEICRPSRLPITKMVLVRIIVRFMVQVRVRTIVRTLAALSVALSISHH